MNERRKFDVDQWASKYRDPREHLYSESIRRELTPERIEKLFVWKNGGNLSKKKAASVRQHYVAKRTEKPNLATSETIIEFLKGRGGPIWSIFWLHCLYPDKYPIYDQHVHRAMAQLERWADKEIASRPTEIFRVYLDQYLQTYNEGYAKWGMRRVDRALWAYGKSLKRGRAPKHGNL
jgi:hypothetical protein